MLDLVKLMKDVLIADSTITAFVGQRIYMDLGPQGNTENDYPQITIHVDDGPTDSLTNDYRPDLQIHIWTRGSGRQTEANLIAKRILLNIDKKSYLTNSPCVFQIWKDNGLGIFEESAQTFHKILTFNVVMEGYSE